MAATTNKKHAKYVFIGGGLEAGAWAAELVAAAGNGEGAIIVSPDPPGCAPYDAFGQPPLIDPNNRSSRTFAGLPLCCTASEPQTVEWYAQNGVELVFGYEVSEARLSENTLVLCCLECLAGASTATTTAPMSLEYDQLVIGTGLQPTPVFADAHPGPGWQQDCRVVGTVGAARSGEELEVVNELDYGFGSVHYVSDIGDFTKLTYALSRAEDDDQETCLDPVAVLGSGPTAMHTCAALLQHFPDLPIVLILPGQSVLPAVFPRAATEQQGAASDDVGGRARRVGAGQSPFKACEDLAAFYEAQLVKRGVKVARGFEALRLWRVDEGGSSSSSSSSSSGSGGHGGGRGSGRAEADNEMTNDEAEDGGGDGGEGGPRFATLDFDGPAAGLRPTRPRPVGKAHPHCVQSRGVVLSYRDKEEGRAVGGGNGRGGGGGRGAPRTGNKSAEQQQQQQQQLDRRADETKEEREEKDAGEGQQQQEVEDEGGAELLVYLSTRLTIVCSDPSPRVPAPFIAAGLAVTSTAAAAAAAAPAPSRPASRTASRPSSRPSSRPPSSSPSPPPPVAPESSPLVLLRRAPDPTPASSASAVGALVVDATMRSTSHPSVFAVGGCSCVEQQQQQQQQQQHGESPGGADYGGLPSLVHPSSRENAKEAARFVARTMAGDAASRRGEGRGDRGILQEQGQEKEQDQERQEQEQAQGADGGTQPAVGGVVTPKAQLAFLGLSWTFAGSAAAATPVLVGDMFGQPHFFACVWVRSNRIVGVLLEGCVNGGARLTTSDDSHLAVHQLALTTRIATHRPRIINVKRLKKVDLAMLLAQPSCLEPPPLGVGEFVAELDEDAMLEAFRYYEDPSAHQTVKTRSLGAIMAELGADWDKDELSEAKSALDPSGKGTVTYSAFRRWWTS